MFQIFKNPDGQEICIRIDNILYIGRLIESEYYGVVMSSKLTYIVDKSCVQYFDNLVEYGFVNVINVDGVEACLNRNRAVTVAKQNIGCEVYFEKGESFTILNPFESMIDVRDSKSRNFDYKFKFSKDINLN